MSAGAEPDPASGGSLRRRIYDLLDPSVQTFWDQVVHHALIALVLVNVLCVVLESVPALEERYRALFLAVELVSVVVFTVEYGLRLWTAVEHMPVPGRSPWQARLAWARTPSAVVDLLAILPFYAALGSAPDLRVLALFRLVRFFKLVRYSAGLTSLVEAIYAERNSLLASLFILSSLVLVMATLMHLVESDAQPDRFGTIPQAMWWAVVTLTTVGYGDVVPVTPLGKVIAGLTAVMGVAMLALPVGIIATAFSEVIHRREFVITWSMVARVPVFARLDAAAIAEIMQLLFSRTVRRGEIVTRRGDPAQALYFIVAGEVEVELQEEASIHLGPGEVFGEIAVLAGEERQATVRACQDGQLLVLQAHDLERLMGRIPEIGARIREIGHARAPDRVAAEPQPITPQSRRPRCGRRR